MPDRLRRLIERRPSYGLSRLHQVDEDARRDTSGAIAIREHRFYRFVR